MSADAISGCPSCVAQELGKPMAEVTLDEYNGWVDAGAMREYFEFYVDRGRVVADFSATCWDCGYHVEFTHRHPLPPDPRAEVPEPEQRAPQYCPGAADPRCKGRCTLIGKPDENGLLSIGAGSRIMDPDCFR